MKTENNYFLNSIRSGVHLAGFGLLAMYVVAILDFTFFDSNLIIWDDAAETFRNLQESIFQYRLHIFFFLLIFILDVIVAMGLYLLLKPVSANISLLTAWFRVMYTAMIGAITVNQLEVLFLLSEANEMPVLESNQLHFLVMSSLNAHADGFSYALIFFGFHILFLAYLVYRSGFLPRILGIFLFVAFLGYLIDGLANLLFPEFRAQNEALLLWFLGISGFIGELVLALYIVIRRNSIVNAVEKLDTLVEMP